MNYKVFIIGIELNRVSIKQGFEMALMGIGEWKRLLDGLYIIKPRFPINSSEELKNRIPHQYRQDGQIFIMRTSIDASWNVDAGVDMWLRINL
jgi:hypothetical protein